MISERECYVYIVLPGSTDFVTAGRFRVLHPEAGDPVGQFVYGRSYLERSDAVEIDPRELRLRRGMYETARMGGFFGALRDAMPYSWGRRVIERATLRAAFDEFDYLMLAPDDRVGALGFGSDLIPPAPRSTFNKCLDLGRLQAAADALLDDRAAEGSSSAAIAEELMLIGTSMGGARPKVVVEHEGELWLAKLSKPTDRWSHPLVERGLLELARACGIDAAESEVTTVGDREVLLVRRFDRERLGDSYLRHRMVSALTLLQSSDEVTSRRDWSYLLLADEIRRSSSSPEKDLRELFSRMCFNAAVSNLDDHPRNHAMLAGSGKGWRLSPAYDLTPSRAISLDRRDLAMTCGRYGRYANRQNLLSEPGRFLLSREEASTLVEDMVGKVRHEWRPTMLAAGVGETDLASIEGAFLYDGFFYDL